MGVGSTGAAVHIGGGVFSTGAGCGVHTPVDRDGCTPVEFVLSVSGAGHS